MLWVTLPQRTRPLFEVLLVVVCRSPKASVRVLLVVVCRSPKASVRVLLVVVTLVCADAVSATDSEIVSAAATIARVFMASVPLYRLPIEGAGMILQLRAAHL